MRNHHNLGVDAIVFEFFVDTFLPVFQMFDVNVAFGLKNSLSAGALYAVPV